MSSRSPATFDGVSTSVIASTVAARTHTRSPKMEPRPSRRMRPYMVTPAMARVTLSSGQKMCSATPWTARSIWLELSRYSVRFSNHCRQEIAPRTSDRVR